MANLSDKSPILDSEAQLVALFDALVDVMFCQKDPEGRYTAVNQAFVRRSGKRSKREVLGATARDLFPPLLAQRYEQQDHRVLTMDVTLRDALELIRRPDGSTGWYLTTKLPLHFDSDRSVAGLVSVSRDLRTPSDRGIALESLDHVVASVHERLNEKIRVADLARIAGCSTAQLERRMKKVFGLSAAQYVTRVRVSAAAEMLTATPEPIAIIAASTGFYDQSSFSRHFARFTGETPVQFRATSRLRAGLGESPNEKA